VTHKEVEKYKKELDEILSKSNSEEQLQQLAKKVGASTIKRYGISHTDYLAELISNIHSAFQTIMVIEACETSAKNYKIAIAAAIAAILSALAAWVAVLK